MVMKGNFEEVTIEHSCEWSEDLLRLFPLFKKKIQEVTKITLFGVRSKNRYRVEKFVENHQDIQGSHNKAEKIIHWR